MKEEKKMKIRKLILRSTEYMGSVRIVLKYKEYRA